MKLPTEFIQLPLRFDAKQLQNEVEALPREAWRPHPTGFKGNSAVPLISVDGGLNDYFAGAMQETRWLLQLPYVRQVLASFGVVLGRSRLMALDGGAEVMAHCDANYHWFTRVRIHVPIVTYPEVDFHCGNRRIHMAAGEAWIFDNWKMHRVVNRSPNRRIHLVADTVGSSAFWSMVERALSGGQADGKPTFRHVGYQPGATPVLRGEKYNTPDVLPPSEVKELCEDLIADLRNSAGVAHRDQADAFASLVRSFWQDWALLWTLHGDEQQGWDDYEKLRDRMLQDLKAVPAPLLLDSNGLPAQRVLFARVLVACLRRPIPGMKTLQFAQ